MSAGALQLGTAAGWQVERGHLFVFAARKVNGGGTGPRAFVTALPAGATLVTDGSDAAHSEGLVLLGVPSTSAYVVPLDGDAVRARLGGADGPAAAAHTARALWSDADGTEVRGAGVVPLEPGVVELIGDAVAESHGSVVWVQARAGSVLLPDGPLPPDGTLVAPRVRVARAGDDAASLEVTSLEEAIARGVVPATLTALLARAVIRAERRAAVDEARVLAAEHQRTEHDAVVERAGIARLAEVVTGPPPLPTRPAVTDPFLACAAMVGAHAGFTLEAEPTALEGREGDEAVRALARASGVHWRRVELTGVWWRVAQDPLLGYRPDGTPVALLPLRGRYQCVESDGTAIELDGRRAAELLDVAFVFSPPLPDRPIEPNELARFTLRDASRDLIALALLGLVAGVVGLAVPLATGVVFDEIIPRGETNRLWWLVGALIAAAIALGLLQYAQAARQTRLEARGARRIGEVTWSRVLSLPTSAASRFGIGDLAGRVAGLDAMREILAGAGLASVATVLASLLVVVVLFIYDVPLALLALAGGLIALLVTLTLATHVGRQSERFQERSATVNGFLREVLRGLPKLRVAGGEARAFDAWADRFAPAMGIEMARSQARLQLVVGLLMPLGTLLLFSAVAARGGAAAIGVGTFLAFQVTYSQYLGTIGQLANTVGTVWQARPLARRAGELLAEAPETGRGRADPGQLQGAVELRDVVFRYQADSAPVLDGLSIYASPGEFLALVGKSGCGKSTVMRLLLGFEAPEAGSVLIDDRDLGSLDVAAVRRQFGVVLQDSQLTPGSVFDNIAAGIALTEDEAWTYAELAAFTDDLRGMPMGMQTMITPGAGAFSGGQRQRLLLARALARRPAVLLLDEATSALDNVTQGVVARNVAHLGITRIVVAHRLSTIESADRIAVIDAGRVVEQGTHAALMASGGAYANLVARQVL